MAKHSLAETTEWVASKLRKATDVLAVEILSNQVLRIERRNYDPFIAGVVSTECVKTDTIKSLITSPFEIEIIANVPKESYWTGAALKLARDNDIATGGFGDLLRVIDVEDVRLFESKETLFIERGLRQHDRVKDMERVHDRLYRIRRNRLPDLTVVMLNEYELTSDHLRTARERYGPFSIAVITNPNGDPTDAAKKVAQTLGVEILKWGAFFGRLNKK